jgi:thioredoxin reductase (NADPH)
MDDLQGTGATETTSMINKPRGLPLSRTHIEQIFPKLNPAQISRIAERGQMRMIELG